MYRGTPHFFSAPLVVAPIQEKGVEETGIVVRTMMLGLSMLICMVVSAATPTITGVTAQQRYPWNGKVDISYTVTGDIAAEANQKALVTSLKVTANDKVANKTYTATKVSGDMALTAGTHKFVWDLDAEGLTFKSSNVVFTVSCETTPALYCVIDLSAGSSASSYPVTYLAEPPSGGFNIDLYKTTKLVLRKVTKGSNSAGGSMSKDMWVGIFEVTEQQYMLVSGTFTTAAISSSQLGYSPGNHTTSAVCALCNLSGDSRSSNFLSMLKTKTGINTRLPTGDEWQYACRAGTKTAYNNGTSATSANMNAVGWCYDNTSHSQYYAQKVGLKAPNAWGLYDMHGNVEEQVSGTYKETLGNQYFLAKFGGGSLNTSYDQCASTYCMVGRTYYSSNTFNFAGLRVFADAE